METKFSKGPWVYEDTYGEWYIKSGEETVCSSQSTDIRRTFSNDLGDEGKANGRLIAAGPEMYELLSEISMASENPRVNLNGYLSDWTDRINSILKKARGE